MSKDNQSGNRKFIQKARGLTDQFTIIPNQVAQNEKLSFKARGLLVYLLSMPETWRIRKTELWQGKRHSTDGRQSIQTAFKELESLGYITSERIPGTSSTLPETLYFVHWSPVQEISNGLNPNDGNPIAENTAAGYTAGGNPAAIKKTPPKETSIKKTPQSTHSENEPVFFLNNNERELFELCCKTFPAGPPTSNQSETFKKLLSQGGGPEKCLNALQSYIMWKGKAGQILHSTLKNFVEKNVITEDWASKPLPHRADKKTVQNAVLMQSFVDRHRHSFNQVNSSSNSGFKEDAWKEYLNNESFAQLWKEFQATKPNMVKSEEIDWLKHFHQSTLEEAITNITNRIQKTKAVV